MPISTIFPGVIWVINGPVPFFEIIAAPLPVTVHWDVGGRWLPSSRGNLNCFSALQKWLEVAHNAFSAKLSTAIADRAIDSTKVEHAPNTPKNGMLSSRSPKLEEIHWLSKSPAKQQSIFSDGIPDLLITVFTVSFIILLSAFSQVFSPQNSSSSVWSKYFARGPCDSFGPTIDAHSVIVGGLSNFIVCFPIFFKKSTPFFKQVSYFVC